MLGGGVERHRRFFFPSRYAAGAMARFDASNAECVVLTFKEGLLSPLAHDLELKIGSFVIEVDEATRAVDAKFDAGSVKVARAIGATLNEKDRRSIDGTIADEVLRARRYPEIRFRSKKVDGLMVEGTLTLHGCERGIAFTVAEEGARWVAEVRLHQPDFGIKPYKAMLGTLRIQADVVVRVSLPK